MALIIFQIVLLVMGALLIITAEGETNNYRRKLNCITGVSLFVLLYLTMFFP